MKKIVSKKSVKKNMGGRIVRIIVAVVLAGLFVLMAIAPSAGKVGACGLADTCCADCSILAPVVDTPVCGFIPSSLEGTAPLLVTFTNRGTVGLETSYRFGDTTFGSGENVTHTYTGPGEYHIVQKIFAADGVTFCYSLPQIVKVSAPTATVTSDPKPEGNPQPPVVPNTDSDTKVITHGSDSPAINVTGNNNRTYVYAQQAASATPVPTTVPTATPAPVISTTNVYNTNNYSYSVVNPAADPAPAPKQPTFWQRVWIRFVNTWRLWVANWKGIPLEYGHW